MKDIVFKIAILIFLFTGCEKTDDISAVPEIKFIGFEVVEGDGEYAIAEGILEFSFIDGDGDIGFGELFDTTFKEKIDTVIVGTDTTIMESTDTILTQINDIFILEYTSNNRLFDHCDTLGPYWLPYFEPGIYRKSIKGEISISLLRTILEPDTARYEFFIFDRAMNRSNIESTPVIIYSELIKQ